MLLFTACAFKPWDAAAAEAHSKGSNTCWNLPATEWKWNECLYSFGGCLGDWWGDVMRSGRRPESHGHDADGAVMARWWPCRPCAAIYKIGFPPTEVICIQMFNFINSGFLFIQENVPKRSSIIRYERRCSLILFPSVPFVLIWLKFSFYIPSFSSTFGFRCLWRLCTTYFDL